MDEKLADEQVTRLREVSIVNASLIAALTGIDARTTSGDALKTPIIEPFKNNHGQEIPYNINFRVKDDTAGAITSLLEKTVKDVPDVIVLPPVQVHVPFGHTRLTLHGAGLGSPELSEALMGAIMQKVKGENQTKAEESSMVSRYAAKPEISTTNSR